MEPIIKLDEIIYEITTSCNQDCDYCGSKGLEQEEINNENIKHIINAISKYPPKAINISGGNPLLVDKIIHKYLINKLENTIKKIIVNPYNIGLNKSNYETVKLYDYIGLSVNTEEELIFAKKILQFISKNNITIITNFNKNNLFDFEFIYNFVDSNNLTWQIQYTMYKDKSPNAIYENDQAYKYLCKKISNVKFNPKIVLADNFNKGISCSAGVRSLGILSNGDVIPCLSMRGWSNKINHIGNLFEDTLEYIWVYKFSNWRCSENTCCKDITNKFYEPFVELKETVKKIAFPSDIWKPEFPTNYPSQIMMYGVFNNGTY